jgi:Zn-dependent peptidase ImmA (M78 family)
VEDRPARADGGVRVASKDTNIGAKRARELRSQLSVDATAPIGCVLTVVERDLGIPVAIARLPTGVAGCCWRNGERVVLWVNGTQAAVRQRFTLAHELGHVRCGHDEGVPVETVETVGGRTTDSREIQANAFAAELLAPAAGVRAAIAQEPTLDDVVLLAARFGISTIAALFRLNSLGLTARYETLKEEIAAGLHDEVWARLAPEPQDDLIAAIETDGLPRFSPSLRQSALAAVAVGESTVATAAASAGCDPDCLAAGANAIGI